MSSLDLLLYTVYLHEYKFCIDELWIVVSKLEYISWLLTFIKSGKLHIVVNLWNNENLVSPAGYGDQPVPLHVGKLFSRHVPQPAGAMLFHRHLVTVLGHKVRRPEKLEIRFLLSRQQWVVYTLGGGGRSWLPEERRPRRWIPTSWRRTLRRGLRRARSTTIFWGKNIMHHVSQIEYRSCSYIKRLFRRHRHPLFSLITTIQSKNPI